MYCIQVQCPLWRGCPLISRRALNQRFHCIIYIHCCCYKPGWVQSHGPDVFFSHEGGGGGIFTCNSNSLTALYCWIGSDLLGGGSDGVGSEISSVVSCACTKGLSWTGTGLPIPMQPDILTRRWLLCLCVCEEPVRLVAFTELYVYKYHWGWEVCPYVYKPLFSASISTAFNNSSLCVCFIWALVNHNNYALYTHWCVIDTYTTGNTYTTNYFGCIHKYLLYT